MYRRSLVLLGLVATSCLLVLLPCNAAESPGLRFLAMGDWGGKDHHPYTTTNEVATAVGMARVVANFGPRFVMGIGDNFYSDGVDNSRDPRFNTTWQQVFTKSYFPVPFYMIAGNHDHHKNVSGEIAYTNKDPTGRWNYPDFFYYFQQTFTTPGGKPVQVAFVMIDTVILCGRWDNKGTPTSRVPPTSPQTYPPGMDKTQLRASGKRPLIGLSWLGHYPVYSVGEHGPTHYLLDNVMPLLQKYGVHLYLNGHDHSLQHIESEGINYVVTGAVHEVDPSQTNRDKIPHDSLKFHYPSHSQVTSRTGGFVSVELYDHHTGILTYHDQDGNKIYQTLIKN